MTHRHKTGPDRPRIALRAAHYAPRTPTFSKYGTFNATPPTKDRWRAMGPIPTSEPPQERQIMTLTELTGKRYGAGSMSNSTDSCIQQIP
jgi:hypothetical protein